MLYAQRLAYIQWAVRGPNRGSSGASSSMYIKQDGKLITEKSAGKNCNEATLTYLEVLYQIICGGVEEKHEELQTRQAMSL
jgi:hypothetical protein